LPSTPPNKPGFSALRPYLSLLRGQELNLLAAAILMIASTAVTLAIPVFAGRFVDAMGSALDGSNPLTSRNLTYLVLLLILQLCGTFSFTVVSARLGLRTITRLRRRLFAHLLELPSLYFTDQKAGDLSSRVTSDVGSIQFMLTSGLVSLARAILTLVGALILMANLNPRLTVVVVLLIPSTILLVRLFGSRLQKLSRNMYDELGRISSHVQETVAGIRTLKVYNNQYHEERRFDGMITTYQGAGMKRAWLSAALESTIQISLWICLISIMVYGFALTARGETTGGELVAFLLLAFRVATPLSSMTSLYSSGQGAIAAAGRLDEIFALPTERQPGAPVPAPSHGAAGITLQDVTFRYPGTHNDQAIIAGMSVKIEPGQWVGIVGPSGAGKTTLAGLIMGLFPPTTGQLLMDDRPYADFDLAELRSRMAFVAQDPMLYDLSLAENIRFGLQEATNEDVRQAAAQAGVLEFADGLPAGLDSLCGEGGAKLSGGQKQRISLARAFLRNPGLLILDEPTSALDAASEQAIQASLRELMTGRTALVIAHRFSLVRDLDLILVVSDGKIVEIGDHQSLMSTEGMYHHLFNLQQGTEN
jgi:subfamily B ATP-binding cassette protein MsbA